MSDKEYQLIHRKVVHRLVQAREDAGLTQQQVGQSKIVTQSELSKIENGQRKLDFILIIQLSILYGKDISFFARELKGFPKSK